MAVIDSLVGKISHDIQDLFTQKYELALETTKDPLWNIYSSWRPYIKSSEYQELLAFCHEQGKMVWPLILQYLGSDTRCFAGGLIMDTTLPEYLYYLEKSYRMENDQSFSDNMALFVYFKELLALLQEKTAQGISEALSQDDQTPIYAAVVRQLATVDDTFGGNLKPATIFILKKTDDRAGDMIGSISNSTEITASLREKITLSLGELSADITWIERLEDAEFEGSDMLAKSIKDGGVIITLGNIHVQDGHIT